MNPVFGSAYAKTYDMVYGEKDYEAECDLLDAIFKTYGTGPIIHILDLGCGTGNHAIPLVRRGYEIVGVDRSESMLNEARQKASGLNAHGRVEFHQADLTSIDLGRQFDAVLLMFAVLGYQITNAAVLNALEVSRRHLRPNALLIFDVWYGPAVLVQRPAQRVKRFATERGELVRIATGELNTERNTCMVQLQLKWVDGRCVIEEIRETHTVRYFFLPELELLCESTGFSLLKVGAFPDFKYDANEHTWNILGIARAR